MRGRQNVLLYLASRLKAQNRQVSRTYLNKLLFVLGKEYTGKQFRKGLYWWLKTTG